MPGKLDWSSAGFVKKRKKEEKGGGESFPPCPFPHLQKFHEVSDEPVIGNSFYFMF